MFADFARRHFKTNVSRCSIEENLTTDVYIRSDDLKNKSWFRREISVTHRNSFICIFILIILGTMLRMNASRIFGEQEVNNTRDVTDQDETKKYFEFSIPPTPNPSPRDGDKTDTKERFFTKTDSKLV